MKARLSLGLSSPQMQRICSSSSSYSASSSSSVGWGFGCGGAGLGGLGLAALGWGCWGAGEVEAFLCRPLVARPERRGSSVGAWC